MISCLSSVGVSASFVSPSLFFLILFLLLLLCLEFYYRVFMTPKAL